MVDDADRTTVGYVCLWEDKFTGANLPRLLKQFYNMVGRMSDVSLSKYEYIRMETFHNNNGQYCVVFQGID